MFSVHTDAKQGGMTFAQIKAKVKQSATAQGAMYKKVAIDEPEPEKPVLQPKYKGHRASVFVKDKMTSAMAAPKVAARTDWAEEDAQKLDLMVESMGGSAKWRESELAKAAQEASERDASGRMWILAQDVFAFLRDPVYFRHRLHTVTNAIAMEMAANPEPVATKVFITFEEQESQKQCLRTLKNGLIEARFNLNLRHADRFRFSNVLEISEAPEPREIRWCELHSTLPQRLFSVSFGVAAVAAFIVTAGVAIKMVIKSPWAVALTIAGLNMLVGPCMVIVSRKERHMTQESEHIWLLFKLIVTRWTISVLLYKWLTPFTETVKHNSIMTIRAILLADMFFKPTLQFLDVPGFIDHYVLAPFATTQEKMNRLFLGTDWSLAERYSDMSKSIFIALSFAAIYPYAYFVCAMTNLLSFMSDKYCLFRVWKQAEPENAKLTAYHRSSLAIAFLAHAIFTLWYFADWPFDNICPAGSVVPDWIAEKLKFDLVDNRVYRQCDMKHTGFILGIRGGRNYMPAGQVYLIFIYKIVTFCTCCSIALAYFGPGAVKLYKDIFVGHVESTIPATNIKFSDVEFIEG